MPEANLPGGPSPSDAATALDPGTTVGAGEIELPHVVVCRGTTTGELSFSGPYPSRLDALRSAAHEERVEREAGGVGEITFHVAPLHPTPGSRPVADGNPVRSRPVE